MTNKLPVIGKRYKKVDNEMFHETFIVEIVFIFENHVIFKHRDNSLGMRPSVAFLQEGWEELPDQEPATEEIETVTIFIKKDGDDFCATLDDFLDLQQSPAGFGDTKVEAIIKLMAEKEVIEKLEITNLNIKTKLPIIGKKYKHTHRGDIGIIAGTDINFVRVDFDDYRSDYDLKDFWERFEELPEQEPATEKQYPDFKYEFLCKVCNGIFPTDMAYYFERKRCCGCVTDEVKEALEELKSSATKEQLRNDPVGYRMGFYNKLYDRAMNLVNALEKQ